MKEKISARDADFEIRFIEGVVRKRPNFTQALSLLGDLYTKRGMYREGLAVDEHLARLRPDDATVLYNLACSYSLLNEVDLSFRNIKLAIKFGYDDFDHLQADPDLKNLRSDIRFQRYFSRARKKAE